MELAWETSHESISLKDVIAYVGAHYNPGVTAHQWISDDKVRIRLEGVSTRFDDRHPIDQWYTIVREGNKIKVWQE